MIDTKKLSEKIAYGKYFDEYGGFNYLLAIGQGMYSRLDFLERFKDNIKYWDDVIFASTIPMNVLIEKFFEYMKDDYVLKAIIEEYDDERLKETEKYFGDQKIQKMKEYIYEYKKYCKEHCI